MASRAGLGGAGSSQPQLLRLAADPARWRVISALSRSDQRVGDLARLTELPQNGVSYHLAKLRGAGMVTSRRSSADGRDTYYRLDLHRCEQLLGEVGAALHPALANPDRAVAPRPAPVSVLFLCTGNSARSQMAEALLAHSAAEAVRTSSAGSHPKPLHPQAIAVMREYGIDISDRRSKHVDEFAGRRFDCVVTVCDKVREVCPPFPGSPRIAHWSIEDPSSAPPAQLVRRFRETAEELSARIDYFEKTL
jgi:ArsR family transcriptional regulator, arsenate/arsenite/antimonite-responsive transcriptional repressor / arsenate reductase (thioredoxin)